MKTAKTLKVIGLLPVGFLALVFVAFGVGESLGGEPGGWMHLFQFVFVGVAIWLCWKYPLFGGAIVLSMALLRGILLIPEFFLRPPASVLNSSMILLILIPAVSGGFFLAAGLMERKEKPAQAQ